MARDPLAPDARDHLELRTYTLEPHGSPITPEVFDELVSEIAEAITVVGREQLNMFLTALDDARTKLMGAIKSPLPGPTELRYERFDQEEADYGSRWGCNGYSQIGTTFLRITARPANEGQAESKTCFPGSCRQEVRQSLHLAIAIEISFWIQTHPTIRWESHASMKRRLHDS
jgi:hypothetical protein